MKVRQFQVDAFASRPFEGNPAAVVLLDHWLPDPLLQALAEENNLSETAYLVAEGDDYRLRWFTPVTEVDLCGHATLASAHVLFEELGYRQSQIRFQTRSGVLTVTRAHHGLQMDFPASPPSSTSEPAILASALGTTPLEILAADDFLVRVDSEATLRALEPDFALLAQLPLRGVIVTAPGTQTDFTSRFFAPKFGINEDPVTGSAHCTLAPYWAEILGRNSLSGWQASRRGGRVDCQLTGERVMLAGTAVTVIESIVRLP